MDLGVTLFAMADAYAAGAAERLVGEAVSARREGLLLATEGGLLFSDEGAPRAVDGSPSYLRQACEASLRRLGVDSIDVYSLAQVDPRVPIEESVGALGELVAAGKIRFIGLRAVTGAQLRRGHAEHPVACVHSPYSLWQRRAETDILPAARELGVTLVCCEPLGRGFLTGHITSRGDLRRGDARRGDPRFDRRNLARNYRLLRQAQEMAAARDVGLGRLALAWLLAQDDDIVPVPGTLNASHAEMNVSAAQITLTGEERRALGQLFPDGAVAGDRPSP